MSTRLFNGYPARIGDHNPGTFRDYEDAELAKQTVKMMRDQNYLRAKIDEHPRPPTAPDAIVASTSMSLRGLPQDAQLTAIRESSDLAMLTRWAAEGGLDEETTSALAGKVKLVSAGGKPPPARR